MIAICSFSFATEYKKYIDDISSRLDKTYELYQKGEVEEAKTTVMSAYFEVFENLEGPIRINVSSKKSYEMESKFRDFRKMINDGIALEELKNHFESFKNEMNEVLPELESGVKIVVHPGVNEPSSENSQNQPSQEINPIWQEALNYIKADLDKAVEVYESEHSIKTRELIQDAQFQGYRNTFLETAIRNFVSNTKEKEIQSKFTELIRFVHTKPSKDELRLKTDEIMNALNSVAVGLGTIDKQEKLVQKVEEENEQKLDFKAIRASLFAVFDNAFKEYQAGNSKKAIGLIQDSYFDIFEGSGMENLIGAKDANLKAQIESYFSKIIALVKNKSDMSVINLEMTKMNESFDKALELLDSSNQSFLSLLLYSLIIITREGFEALLIVTAIIAYLVKSNNQDKLNIVYSSVSVAIVLSFITAFVMSLIFGQASAQNREILEGATMLVASLLLFYVSYWLLSNATAKKWTDYIKSSVAHSLDNKSKKALWLTCFLAVYREGAETVLFYQALIADATSNLGYVALVSGFLIGVVILAVAYFIMKFTAIKLPIRAFFLFTGVFIYLMAFVFIGKGIMEFVEGKLFEPTLIEGLGTFTPLGFYPYYESVISQSIVVLIGIFGLYLLIQKSKKRDY